MVPLLVYSRTAHYLYILVEGQLWLDAAKLAAHAHPTLVATMHLAVALEGQSGWQ